MRPIKANFDLSYSSEFIVEAGAFAALDKYISKQFLLKNRIRKILFIVDGNFSISRGRELISQMQKLRCETIMEVVEAGEFIKSLGGAEAIMQLCLKHNIKRDCALAAVGGGTVCDAVGFVASIYMRGLTMINIPTTVMSCSDPILGKVAVNHALRKNLIGSWFFPNLTVIDPLLIKRDNDRYYRTGIAEIIKSALIQGGKAFSELEADMDRLLSADKNVLAKYIKMCIDAKIKCVSGDERDTLNRHANLSLGHTLADSLESLFPFGQLTHGEAVSIGMLFAAHVCGLLKNRRAKSSLYKRLRNLVSRAGLPTKIPSGGAVRQQQIITGLLLSKKSKNNSLTLVLPLDFGRLKIVSDIDPNIIKKALKEIL